MQFTEEQILIRDTARQFAQQQLAPYAAERSKTATYPSDALKMLGELGFMGMLVPEKWGGVDCGYIAYVLAIEEIAAGEGATSTIVTVHNSVGCLPIYNYGTEAQKNEYLRPLAQGKYIGAFCLTEPQAGSDAYNLKTRAVLQDDHYVINGTKEFITSGKHADIAIVFAVTDPNAGKKGISAFIVPTKTPGYKVSRIEEKMGQHAAVTAEITFDNMRLPKQQLLGKEGEGYKIALSNLEGGRIGIAAQAVGMARSAYEAALRYAQEREAFGKKIIEHQAVGFKLADMATQLDAARLLTLQAAFYKEHNFPCIQQAAMAKLFASEAADRICYDAIQIHGGYGYLQDFPVERIYCDARVTQIYEGTSDIQRLVISKAIRDK